MYAQHLLQFAQMGAAYMREYARVQKPRIGILANGNEDVKGTKLTRAAIDLIREAGYTCVGYCEGNHLFNGLTHVIVSDGLSGNIALKTIEGTARTLANRYRSGIQKLGARGRLAAFVLSGVYRKLREAHGSVSAKGIARAIRRAHEGIHVSAEIEKEIGKYSLA